LPFFVVSFLRLNRFNGFGGGGGPPGGGATCDAVGLLLVVSDALLFEVSFLCFLKGFIFLKISSGEGGGGGGVGAVLCENECDEIHTNPMISGGSNRYFSLAEYPGCFLS
jgi:hypothetical protein